MTNILAGFLNSIVGMIIELIPAPVGLDQVLSMFDDNVYTAWDFIAQVNFIVPLDTILTIIGLDIAFRVYMFFAYIVKNVFGATFRLLSTIKIV